MVMDRRLRKKATRRKFAPEKLGAEAPCKQCKKLHVPFKTRANRSSIDTGEFNSKKSAGEVQCAHNGLSSQLTLCSEYVDLNRSGSSTR